MKREYLCWDEKTIMDFSDKNINTLYNEGYVFTRIAKGVMNQTRSVRIDLDKFELSSENRRVLKKTGDWGLEIGDLPLSNYSWKIGKMAKDFYENKFGKGVFSANKVKELLTDDYHFNKLFIYRIIENLKFEIGYCIALETGRIIHYSYPFYHLSHITNNIGMGMMLKAILYAKENEKKYIYLGSVQRPRDKYKLQFYGLEWFNGEKWSDDLEELKNIL